MYLTQLYSCAKYYSAARASLDFHITCKGRRFQTGFLLHSTFVKARLYRRAVKNFLKIYVLINVRISEWCVYPKCWKCNILCGTLTHLCTYSVSHLYCLSLFSICFPLRSYFVVVIRVSIVLENLKISVEWRAICKHQILWKIVELILRENVSRHFRTFYAYFAIRMLILLRVHKIFASGVL